MLLTPEFYFVMRCPHCQEQILYRTFSLFQLKNKEKIKVLCSCGSVNILIWISGQRHIYIDANCPCCMEFHSFIYNINELKGDYPISLTCAETDLHLGYLGEKKAVLETLNLEGLTIIDYQDELKEYFLHPQLIAESLIYINQLLINNAINCSCQGNHSFDIEIQDQQIIIKCAHCGNKIHILAARASHLAILKRTTAIKLKENSSSFSFNQKNENTILLHINKNKPFNKCLKPL